MPNPPLSFSFEPAHNSLSFFFSLLLHPTFTGYLAFPLHKFPSHRAPFSFSSIFLCSPRLIHLQFKVTVTKKRERRTKMNRCAYQYHQQQQKAAAMVGFGCVSELRRGENCSNTFSMANTNGVVCPKPRRIVNNNFNDSISIIRPSRFLHNNNQQMEACESKAGIELLDIIRPKQGDYGFEKSSYQVASSPPFYNGSPPVRASNPLIQDEQFGNEKLLSPLSPSPAVDPPTAAGGRGRVSYRHNQPNVRVEGFNCSVYAIA